MLDYPLDMARDGNSVGKFILALALLLCASPAAAQEPSWHGAGWYAAAGKTILAGPSSSYQGCQALIKPSQKALANCTYISKDPASEFWDPDTP